MVGKKAKVLSDFERSLGRCSAETVGGLGRTVLTKRLPQLHSITDSWPVQTGSSATAEGPRDALC